MTKKEKKKKGHVGISPAICGSKRSAYWKDHALRLVLSEYVEY